MNSTPSFRFSLAPAVIAVVLSASTPAQAPWDWDGWYAVASSDTAFLNLGTGPGGLFMVHPTNGAVVSITGLPAALTGAGIGTPQGARSLAHDPDTGHFWVGEATYSGTTLSLREIALGGPVATVVRTVAVGSSGGGNRYSGIQALARHPDGRLFMVLDNVTQGPLAGFRLAVFDPAAKALTGIPLPPAILGISAALAVDSGGRTLYFGSWTQTTVALSALDLVTMQVTALAPRGNYAPVDVDATGRVLVVGRSIEWLDPATGIYSACQSGPAAWHNGAGIERSTGSIALVTGNDPNSSIPGQNLAYRIDGCAGTPVLLSAGPPGGWGTLTDIELVQSPRTYGAPTPGPDLAWQVVASPAGRPAAGNAGFVLTLDMSPNAGPAVALLFGTGSGLFTVLGVDLLIDITTLFATVPTMLNAGTNTIPIPIPAHAGLVGNKLRVQAAALTGAGITASDGLRFGIL